MKFDKILLGKVSAGFIILAASIMIILCGALVIDSSLFADPSVHTWSYILNLYVFISVVASMITISLATPYIIERDEFNEKEQKNIRVLTGVLAIIFTGITGIGLIFGILILFS